MPSLEEVLQAAVYDLSTVAPHEPEGARFTAAEFALYRRGYDYALVMVAKVIAAAAARFKLRTRTKRLEARRRRAK